METCNRRNKMMMTMTMKPFGGKLENKSKMMEVILLLLSFSLKEVVQYHDEVIDVKASSAQYGQPNLFGKMAKFAQHLFNKSHLAVYTYIQKDKNPNI